MSPPNIDSWSYFVFCIIGLRDDFLFCSIVSWSLITVLFPTVDMKKKECPAPKSRAKNIFKVALLFGFCLDNSGWMNDIFFACSLSTQYIPDSIIFFFIVLSIYILIRLFLPFFFHALSDSVDFPGYSRI